MDIWAVRLKSDQRLTEIRKNRLVLWHQKKLPPTEVIRRQDTILSAGHFEAYNIGCSEVLTLKSSARGYRH